MSFNANEKLNEEILSLRSKLKAKEFQHTTLTTLFLEKEETMELAMRKLKVELEELRNAQAINIPHLPIQDFVLSKQARADLPSEMAGIEDLKEVKAPLE